MLDATLPAGLFGGNTNKVRKELGIFRECLQLHRLDLKQLKGRIHERILRYAEIRKRWRPTYRKRTHELVRMKQPLFLTYSNTNEQFVSYGYGQSLKSAEPFSQINQKTN